MNRLPKLILLSLTAVYLFVSLAPNFAQALDEKCSEIFLTSHTTVPKGALKAVFAKPNEKLVSLADGSSIRDTDFNYLTQSIISSNSGVLGLNLDKMRIVAISKASDDYPFPVFTARIEGNYEGGLKRRYVEFRSNGFCAFLHNSYKLSQQNPRADLKAVYVGESNSVFNIDQTKILLESLPPEIILSRVMSSDEQRLWTAGQYDQFRFRSSDERTHFALNDYDFVHPDNIDVVKVQVKVPKSVLSELWSEQLLAINTYQSESEHPLVGMKSGAKTPFGLEIEIVVFGLEGRQKLGPYMRSAFP
jgi:hypothetical protein